MAGPNIPDPRRHLVDKLQQWYFVNRHMLKEVQPQHHLRLFLHCELPGNNWARIVAEDGLQLYHELEHVTPFTGASVPQGVAEFIETHARQRVAEIRASSARAKLLT